MSQHPGNQPFQIADPNFGLGFATGVAGMIAGAVVGGVIHYFLARQGLYMLALVGILTGIGCSMATTLNSRFLGVLSAITATVTAIVLHRIETGPFIVNESFWYFLTHLHQTTNATIFGIMTVFGAVLAFFSGSRGRRR